MGIFANNFQKFWDLVMKYEYICKIILQMLNNKGGNSALKTDHHWDQGPAIGW